MRRQLHKDVLLSWSLTTVQHCLSPEEVVVLAAEFCGLAIPKCRLTLEGQNEMINVAGRIVATSCIGNNAVAAGYGRPVSVARDQKRDDQENP